MAEVAKEAVVDTTAEEVAEKKEQNGHKAESTEQVKRKSAGEGEVESTENGEGEGSKKQKTGDCAEADGDAGKDEVKEADGTADTPATKKGEEEAAEKPAAEVDASA